jgi:hypothetical protein
MHPFAILQHRTRDGVHFDLLLDRGDGGALATWSLSEMPTPGGRPIPARRLADHRRIYLTYEGPIAGDRGEARIAAAGVHEIIERADDRLVLRLDAPAVGGRYELRREPSGGLERWLMTAL